MIYAGSSYHNYAPYILVTDAGCRMTASDTVGVMDFYLIESGIHASEEIQVSSDRRIKNSIDYDLDKYENFFMALKPSTFKYNKGSSGRKHTGFIAQDVEDALLNNDLTTDEFAGLTIQTYQDGDDPIQDTDNNFYRLRYGEFISLNTYMIQKLYKRIERLENELKEYKKEEN